MNNAALVPSRRLHRRIHKDLRSIGKGLSSEAFLADRQAKWKNCPVLQAKHQHSFELYLAAELAECISIARQQQVF